MKMISKTSKNSDQSKHLSEQKEAIFEYFFSEKQDSLRVIFDIVNTYGLEGCVYQDIYQKFKKNQKNVNLFLISHYIRKLVKMNLVELKTRRQGTTFVKLVRSKLFKKTWLNLANLKEPLEVLKKRDFKGFLETKMPALVTCLRDKNDYRPSLSFEDNVVKSFYTKQIWNPGQEGLLMSDLYDKTVSQFRRKSLNRTIDRLMGSGLLQRKPKRDGKNYFFEYFTGDYRAVIELLDKSEPSPSIEHKESGSVSEDEDMFSTPDNLIMNDESLKVVSQVLLSNKFSKNKWGELTKRVSWFQKNRKYTSEKLYRKINEQRESHKEFKRDQDIILTILISDDLSQKKTQKRSKRKMTQFRIDRMIRILNMVYSSPTIINLNDIRKEFVEEFEKEMSFKIDKKTVRNLITQLGGAGLLKTRKMKITSQNLDTGFKNISFKHFVFSATAKIDWTKKDLKQLAGVKRVTIEKGSYCVYY